MIRRNVNVTILGIWICVPVGSAYSSDTVSFSRDVLPVLSDRCFHCHGPDENDRAADLRLDLEEAAKEDLGGYAAIVGGNLEESEIWQRIITEDEDLQMPPTDSHRKPLTKSEREAIRRWILDGAPWGKHWAFEKPVRPAVPDRAKHPIDAFIRDKLAEQDIEPSPPADHHTQLRRLSFDLTGLPPLAHELDQTDWQAAVDRKLSSPHHGERLAMWWLDAARYSDTDGYQQDSNRTNWPWRDWVIESFNHNMPFDQFTIEQFAGDLLPDATQEQILATCFHRNHMTNGEGGRLAEESRIDYVIDRVNTTGTVWLGLTLGCVQCHDHKFDPISQKDYYSLFAFFNSIEETGAAGTKAKPYLSYQSPHAAGAVTEAENYVRLCEPLEKKAKADAEQRFNAWLANAKETIDPQYKAWKRWSPTSVKSAEGTQFEMENDGTIQTSGPYPRQDDYRIQLSLPDTLKRITGWKLEVLPHASHTDGKLSRGKNGEFILTNVKLLVRRDGASQVHDVEMRGAIADFEKPAKFREYGKVKDTLDDDPRNGWTTETGDGQTPHTAVFELKSPLSVLPGDEWTVVLLQRSTNGDSNIGRFRISATDQRGETVRKLDAAPFEELAQARSVSEQLRGRLLNQFLLDDVLYQKAKLRIENARRQLADLKKAAGKLNVQVLAERKEPRDSHVLVRGEWDAKGDIVQPGMPPAVLPMPAEQTGTRLDLARWIVSPENPLTARVIVNHLWQMMFGAGLVRTPDDFGLQGEFPTHPELLDWLAVELMEHDWNLRHILRLIATSETYRQSSHVNPELLNQDPENRLLARAPRFRLPAWMIRDSALQSAGLLNRSIGGPPVNPWQPDGVWREIFMGRFTYRPSVGAAQYRRTLYAFWRRSSAPTFLFDSAQRRVCEVGIRRTNTPLHALTLLNDTTMLESARVLAESTDQFDDTAMRILSRHLRPDELTVLQNEYKKAIAYYRSQREEAIELLTVGQQGPPPQDRAADLAARMIVASMMLNLDEAITHE
ncbi:MAG: PSD1 and planctomycete cytochrome C domain-containing protein [Planctomycetota bacterium]